MNSETLQQDPIAKSKRVKAMAAGVLAGVFTLPELQSLLVAIVPEQYSYMVPLTLAFLASAFAGWSKVSDKRPKRGST